MRLYITHVILNLVGVCSVFLTTQISFYLCPTSGPSVRLLCKQQHELVLLPLPVFLFISWLLAIRAAGDPRWHSRDSSCAKSGSQQVSVMPREWITGNIYLNGRCSFYFKYEKHQGFLGLFSSCFFKLLVTEQ